jgi:hypothetical protein
VVGHKTASFSATNVMATVPGVVVEVVEADNAMRTPVGETVFCDGGRRRRCGAPVSNGRCARCYAWRYGQEAQGKHILPRNKLQ